MAKKDNSTLRKKVLLRRKALGYIKSPIVLETHGGYGEVWSQCYTHLADGVVFDKDPERAAFLARQRPTWAVYEADSVYALAGGAASHQDINFVDIDSYGDPWPTIGAFLGSERPRPKKLCIVVNDGLRQNVRLGTAWRVATLQDAVRRFGNDLHDIYLEVCRSLMEEKATQAGYSLDHFAGYYCGSMKEVTHYVAVLVC